MKGLLGRLKRKYGPLPLWAWAAIVGGALAVVWRLRSGGQAPAEAVAAPAIAFGPGEPDYGDTGSSAVPGVPGVAAEPALEGELYPDDKLRQASMELIDQIRGISDELGAADAYPPETYDVGGEDVVEPETGRSTSATKGVPWYGRVFKTKGGLARELGERGYRGFRDPAKAFREWSRLHPGAAKKLGGKVPKPGKPPRATKPQRSSTRAESRAPAKKGAGKGGARARTTPKAAARPPARPRQTPARGKPAPATRKPAKGRPRAKR